jgi:hypothetical protein
MELEVVEQEDYSWVKLLRRWGVVSAISSMRQVIGTWRTQQAHEILAFEMLLEDNGII